MATRNLGVTIAGLATAAVSALVLYDESMRGFPDSHLTEYDRAIGPPRTILAWVSLVAAAYLVLAGISARARIHWLVQTALVVIVGCLLGELVVLHALYSGLDSGQGG